MIKSYSTKKGNLIPVGLYDTTPVFCSITKKMNGGENYYYFILEGNNIMLIEETDKQYIKWLNKIGCLL